MRTDGAITLYHVEIDPESRKEIFKRHCFLRASIYQEIGEERRHSQDGPWRSRETVIRIPTQEEIVIGIGDRVVLGLCAENEPPHFSLLVNSIADNRRGSIRTHHYKIICR